MWDYSQQVKDHFIHPRNIGVLENPDGVGTEGSLACGDALTLMFKLDDQGRIAEARFQTFGCASAIASASMLTEMIQGLTVEEAAKITNRDIVERLGGLPKEKIHCSVMGQEALATAIAYYRHGGPVKKTPKPGRVVCNCFGITEPEIEQALREHHLTTVKEVMDTCQAGTACGSCLEDIEEIVQRINQQREQENKEEHRMTNLERIEKIKQVMTEIISPALQRDGGDIQLIDVEGDVVKVQLQGACSGCPMSAMTLSHFVEAQLREHVSPDIRLQAVR